MSDQWPTHPNTGAPLPPILKNPDMPNRPVPVDNPDATMRSTGAEDDDDDDVTLYGDEAAWDGGGPSDCGYHETVHHTLMAVGEKVHTLVGEPDSSIKDELRALGNWFQEASYATRDFVQGHSNMKEDALEAVKAIVRNTLSNKQGGTLDDSTMDNSEFSPPRQ